MSEMQTDVNKVTGLSTDAITALRKKIRGDLIQPGDHQYDEARKVYNAMIDKRPALIIRCVDAADVSSAVAFGCDQGLDIAVRGGSHNGPGFGVVDEGLVIDLSRMRGIWVEPDKRTVRVQGGAVWGDVDHATYPFGLAVPSGFVSTTGVGGLTLGGGIGYLSRRYGLTIDNLLSVDMVLADGCFITADKDHNEDLFWAVRGGGGNFGIVTSFLFKANPVATVYGGPMIWPMEESGAILRYWQDLILRVPEELNGFFAYLTIPPGPPFPEQYHLQKMCGVVWCYTGPIEKAEQVFKPIRSFRQPAIDFVGPVPFPALQSLFDAILPAGMQWYWKADFFDRYEERAIEQHVKYGSQLPTPESTMHIYPINGAAGQVGKQETAFSFRGANFAQVVVGVSPEPSNNGRLMQWARDYHQALHPSSLGGGYVNMIMDEGQDKVKSSYGDNYTRLAKIKAKYDPNNLFHINQNIPPMA
jgi:FAD/FMN-containing dehydrogenase